MQNDSRIALLVVIGGAAVAYATFSMPALTSGGNQRAAGVTEAAYETAVTEEMTFCEEQPDNVDCGCFAEKSAFIQTHRAPKVPGATYTDKRQLARNQAVRAC